MAATLLAPRGDGIAAAALAATLGLHGAAVAALLLIDLRFADPPAPAPQPLAVSLVSPLALAPAATVRPAAMPPTVRPAPPPADVTHDAGVRAVTAAEPSPGQRPSSAGTRRPATDIAASLDSALAPEPDAVASVPSASTRTAAGPGRAARPVAGRPRQPVPPDSAATAVGESTEIAARKPATTEISAIAAPPQTGAAPTAGETEIYLASLRAWIDRHKRFPRHAERRGEEGTVLVRVVMARDGAVLSRAVARTSGHAALDREAALTIDRAAPLPAAPRTLPGDRMELIVPISFALRK